MNQSTCDQCLHFVLQPHEVSPPAGVCQLMADEAPQREDNLHVYCTCGDQNGDSSISVGPKFGCIHWVAKA